MHFEQGERTQVVHDIRLAPLGPERAFPIGTLDEHRVEQQVVDLVLTQTLQCLLGERADILHVRQLERQHRQAVARGIELELVIGRLRARCVARAEDDLVRLSLREELLDGFEALWWGLISCRSVTGGA